MGKCNRLLRGTKHFSFRNVNCTAPLPGNKIKRNPKASSCICISSALLVGPGGELLRLKRVKDGTGSGSEMSDGNKLTGQKRRREEAGTFEDVARYWARVSKNKERFALSYLDKLAFSWSVEDVFNRNLFSAWAGGSARKPPAGTSAAAVIQMVPAVESWHRLAMDSALWRESERA